MFYTNLQSPIGIWVFGPAFKEQQELKNAEAGLLLNASRKPLEAIGEAKEDEVKMLRAAEAAASRSAATEAALKPGGSSSSWWPRLLWTGNDAGDKAKPSTDTVSEAIKKERKKDVGEK
ncbi:hypothetical protein LAWI1_G002907 [Lachnellula willkommii]|uniref:Uncharacterized protein n=1 Tax=Lachnellula willkommii TaxID=215461 RepID=A0A559MCI3_9HELO|nr:hypothetical protein LAWI1_G002907 [Lachnellula willkommii]